MAAVARAPDQRVDAFDEMLTKALASAGIDDNKALAAASEREAARDEQDRQDEKREEDVRQNLPPELAGLAANIAAGPNLLAWQGTVSAADAQIVAEKLAVATPAATTTVGVDSIDAALNALQAAGVMSLEQEATPAKQAVADERGIAQSSAQSTPQSARTAEIESLQNMLMAARQLTAPATVSAPVALAANPLAFDPAMPAVRVQVLELADDGGSHTVLKSLPSDGAALGIDLKLDGQGNATLILNVANDAEHMRLQQTLTALHAGFEAMGLALNVELRQGDDQNAPAPMPEAISKINAARSVADADVAPLPRVRDVGNAGPGESGPQIHFYA